MACSGRLMDEMREEGGFQIYALRCQDARLSAVGWLALMVLMFLLCFNAWKAIIGNHLVNSSNYLSVTMQMGV